MRTTIISWCTLAVFLAAVYSVAAQTFTETHTVSVSARVGSIPTLDEPGGGGGGTQSGVRFSGLAYPFATITVQRGTAPDMTIRANSSGVFSIVIPDTTINFFTLFATDISGRRSTILNFPTVSYSGYLTDISGIRFAPTLVLDKLAMKQGDFISVSGSGLPGIPAVLSIEGPQSTTFTLAADTSGAYAITVPLSLVRGEYIVRIGYEGDTRTSKAIRLIIGDSNILKTEATANIPGDCNVDGRVTIVDFSVLAYWFGKQNPPTCVDPNHDKAVTLVDFSIVAFYWNG